MSTEHIDDLFRRQLGDHETPPGDDLWARLQAGPAADATPVSEPVAAAPTQVDQLFQQRLQAHATPVPREIWERLEDEHLRPRKRRAAAWWPLAVAAAVALLLLAGGAGLWLGFPVGRGASGTVGSQPGSGSRLSDSNHASSMAKSAALPTEGSRQSAISGAAQIDLAATAAATATEAAGAGTNATAKQSIAQASQSTIYESNKKNLTDRATRFPGPASSASKVGMMAQQSPRHLQDATRQLDAVAPPAPLVARTMPPSHTPTLPADEPAPAVIAANQSSSTPNSATENVLAVAPTSLPAATLITVDVRNGAPRRPSLATAVATAAAGTEDRPGLGGRLLRQVGRAVRGERISLSEVTGLPENLTLEANIGGRHVSKSIQL